jgi:hypothetical protein
LFAAPCVWIGEILSLIWFYKELKNDLSKNNCFRGVILVLLIRESIFIGWGFPFSIVLVPRYKLSLCHTSIKPDLLGFSRNNIFACGLHDHVITSFESQPISTLSPFEYCHYNKISHELIIIICPYVLCWYVWPF